MLGKHRRVQCVVQGSCCCVLVVVLKGKDAPTEAGALELVPVLRSFLNLLIHSSAAQVHVKIAVVRVAGNERSVALREEKGGLSVNCHAVPIIAKALNC